VTPISDNPLFLPGNSRTYGTGSPADYCGPKNLDPMSTRIQIAARKPKPMSTSILFSLVKALLVGAGRERIHQSFLNAVKLRSPQRTTAARMID
jgi:hypothetical protein